ncbi:MAG: hypothetical protein HYW63_03230 [Candidatus Levybacteria bacterium]|nr:hypothetical protein [Candidatus Levybacteria bacterium]
MFLLTLPVKILGITGTIILITVVYWLFVGVGLNFGVKNEPCAQVMAKAKNPISGVEREFSSPCKVPVGWQITEEGRL